MHVDSLTCKIKRRLLFTFARFYSDRLFLEKLFPLRTGYPLNLDNPKTFNEKLQWLKLYDRNPTYIRMVDKIEAKKYVAEIIGEKYVVPTYAVYERVEDIDFDALPDQFVLKCSHDSGGVVLCKGKASFKKYEAIKKLKRAYSRNYYWKNREWPYKDIKPRIIAEKYLTDDGVGLKDYKFFCFNGIPRAMFLLKDREVETRLNFYDMDFKKLPFERGYPNFDGNIEKPSGWDVMINISKRISQNIPLLRVDFYSVNNNVFIGELTFYPGSGMEPFIPSCWDDEFGKWLKLPSDNLER